MICGCDAENHLTAVSGAAQAQFKYNGDGQRVVATEGITTTVFVGNYFEWRVNDSQTTKYYYVGGTRVAMQRGGQGVKYLLGDHLGSASVVLNADGTSLGAQGYHPWGEVNFTEGTMPTEYTFTGQFSYVSRFGMAYFNARWYLPELGRFSQPDTIVPGSQGVQAFDRFAYANNNALKYTDPSGHQICRDDYCGRDDNDTGSLAESLLEAKDWWRLEKIFGIRFTGTKTWTFNMKLAVYQAVVLVAMAFAKLAPGFTPEEIFEKVYGASIEFEYGNCKKCDGAYGYTHSANHIEFGGMYDNLTQATRLVVHELGHAFDQAIGAARGGTVNIGARGDLTGKMGTCADKPTCLGRDGSVNQSDGGYWGFAGGFGDWQFSEGTGTGEVWADMFLGWVFGEWEDSTRGVQRRNYMGSKMLDYLTLLTH